MKRIREALDSVESFADRVEDRSVKISVDRAGHVVLNVQGRAFVPLGKGAAQGITDSAGLDLVDIWQVHDAVVGPHLFEPRRTLRIIPGKLSGEPHALGTRIPTRMVWSLRGQGLDAEDIIELYPRLSRENVIEAIDLEDELERNLANAA